MGKRSSEFWRDIIYKESTFPKVTSKFSFLGILIKVVFYKKLCGKRFKGRGKKKFQVWSSKLLPFISNFSHLKKKKKKKKKKKERKKEKMTSFKIYKIFLNFHCIIFLFLFHSLTKDIDKNGNFYHGFR